MKNKHQQIRTLTLCAILTAIVFVVQYLGAAIRFGTFSISLVLIPIVIGAAVCGPWAGAWLGFVFGVVVLMSGDAAAFLTIDAFGTFVIVLAKGTLAGLGAGLIYKLLEKVNIFLATAVAAVVCPVINSGIFALGCFTFFLDAMKDWAPAGQNTLVYVFVSLIGINFLLELAANVILTPVIVRVLKAKKK